MSLAQLGAHPVDDSVSAFEKGAVISILSIDLLFILIALFSWEELGARPHRATGATFDGSEDCKGGRKPEIDSNEKRYKGDLIVTSLFQSNTARTFTIQIFVFLFSIMFVGHLNAEAAKFPAGDTMKQALRLFRFSRN